MTPKLSDSELQFLKQCYQCYKDGKNFPGTILDVPIPNFTVDDMIECERSLMQKNFLSGSTEHSNAGMHYFPDSITQKGINVVEEILGDPLFGDLEPAINLGYGGKKYRLAKYAKTHLTFIIGTSLAIIGIVLTVMFAL